MSNPWPLNIFCSKAWKYSHLYYSISVWKSPIFEIILMLLLYFEANIKYEVASFIDDLPFLPEDARFSDENRSNSKHSQIVSNTLITNL
jgi:hypothetical protein